MLCQFLAVVHQREELPLAVHRVLPAEGESIESLVEADVAEDRRGGAEPRVAPAGTFGTP